MSSSYVSIILPTYNRSHILEDCLNSVVAQTYRNWELVVGDDASTDNTSLIMGELKKRDLRIQWYRNESNQGLHKNRNKAISLSKGELLFFIEDDIILAPDCLQVLVETFEELKVKGEKIGIIAPSLESVEESGQVLQRKLFDYFKSLKKGNMNVPCTIDSKTGLMYKNFSSVFKELQQVEDVHACCVYPKTIFEEFGGFEEKAYQGNYLYGETELNLKIRKKGYKLFFQPNALTYHKTTPVGGCRLPAFSYGYYAIRNHVIFITRNFGIKSLYMVPSFLLYVFFVLIKYAHSRTTGKE